MQHADVKPKVNIPPVREEDWEDTKCPDCGGTEFRPATKIQRLPVLHPAVQQSGGTQDVYRPKHVLVCINPTCRRVLNDKDQQSSILTMATQMPQGRH